MGLFFLEYCDFLGIFFGISWHFFGFILRFLSKLLSLLLKVTKLTTWHKKIPKMSQNSIISPVFARRAKKALGQSMVVFINMVTRERARRLSSLPGEDKGQEEGRVGQAPWQLGGGGDRGDEMNQLHTFVNFILFVLTCLFFFYCWGLTVHINSVTSWQRTKMVWKTLHRLNKNKFTFFSITNRILGHLSLPPVLEDQPTMSLLFVFTQLFKEVLN